jgi:hypothetical protein
MTKAPSPEVLIASNVLARTEQFTPDYAVQSVDFAIEGSEDESVLSIQRAIGAEADDPPESCLVFSPSQQCAVNPFASLVLSRSNLDISLTHEAQEVFAAPAVTISFNVSDDLHSAIYNQLSAICAGFTFFRNESNL